MATIPDVWRQMDAHYDATFQDSDETKAVAVAWRWVPLFEQYLAKHPEDWPTAEKIHRIVYFEDFLATVDGPEISQIEGDCLAELLNKRNNTVFECKFDRALQAITLTHR